MAKNQRDTPFSMLYRNAVPVSVQALRAAALRRLNPAGRIPVARQGSSMEHHGGKSARRHAASAPDTGTD